MWKELCPEKALIFRIVHRDNLAWIFDHGLHCRNSPVKDSGYINIGNPELIDKRHTRNVAVEPYGTLSDYIPFYFTPFSVMMYNIKTGHNGITKRHNREIAILVSSLHLLKQIGIRFLFTDRHAYLRAAQFNSDLSLLNQIDWSILQGRDFRRDYEDLEKVERYQAEALIHRHMPTDALLGVVCCDEPQSAEIRTLAQCRSLDLKVYSKAGWYFQ